MLLDAEKTDVRRFCGYPAYGAGVAGNMGWRFYQAYGAMEYRLNNLSPSEESVLRAHLSNLRAFETSIRRRPPSGPAIHPKCATASASNRIGGAGFAVSSACRPVLH
jgi:hypothetical protein